MGLLPRKEVVQFLEERVGGHPLNRAEDGAPYFQPPRVALVDAGAQAFIAYKTIIGQEHQLPAESFESHFGAGSFPGGIVISYSLPLVEKTRAANGAEKTLPCRRWAHTRDFGQQFIDALGAELVAWLADRNIRAVVPSSLPSFRRADTAEAGIASSWSERHAAFAAGLGTFSLNDAMITDHGIAHRLGSVIAACAADELGSAPWEIYGNCLHHAKGTCGACVKRCPAGAITKEGGHDKRACMEYSYGVVMNRVGEAYGVSIAGCGLCQTAVPCESKNPMAENDDA